MSRRDGECIVGMPGAAIEFSGISRCFGTVKAVDEVSFSIMPGEFFTLLGPSGSGKTTLLHLLAGFQRPDAGEIRLDGEVISDLPPFRRGIGVVFQSYALFPHMTVFENVAFPLRVRKLPKAEISARVKAALALVQLEDYGRRRISQLSGGQQQRVAFARAVVFGPRLLLMDEPLSALDAKLRKTMRAEIKQLQQSLGVTVVYVTHDQDEAMALSDRVAVMREGKLEQLAPPTELYEAPTSRFVADFVGEMNLVAARVLEQRNGSFVLLSIGSHRFVARSTSPVNVDDVVHLGVRPERITLNPSAHLSNIAAGTVTATVYGGDHVMASVDIGGGLTLTLKLETARGIPPRPGEAVTVGWRSDQGIVLTH